MSAVNLSPGAYEIRFNVTKELFVEHPKVSTCPNFKIVTPHQTYPVTISNTEGISGDVTFADGWTAPLLLSTFFSIISVK